MATDALGNLLEGRGRVHGHVVQVHDARGALRAELEEILYLLAPGLVETLQNRFPGRLVGEAQHVRRFVGVEPADELPEVLAVHVVHDRRLERLR